MHSFFFFSFLVLIKDPLLQVSPPPSTSFCPSVLVCSCPLRALSRYWRSFVVCLFLPTWHVDYISMRRYSSVFAALIMTDSSLCLARSFFAFPFAYRRLRGTLSFFSLRSAFSPQNAPSSPPLHSKFYYPFLIDSLFVSSPLQ